MPVPCLKAQLVHLAGGLHRLPPADGRGHAGRLYPAGHGADHRAVRHRREGILNDSIQPLTGFLYI